MLSAEPALPPSLKFPFAFEFELMSPGITLVSCAERPNQVSAFSIEFLRRISVERAPLDRLPMATCSTCASVPTTKGKCDKV